MNCKRASIFNTVFLLTFMTAWCSGIQADDLEEVPPLADAVADYLDRVDAFGRTSYGESPSYGRLWKTYGSDEAMKETLDQTLARDSDYADYKAIANFGGVRPVPELVHKIAARGLEGELPKLKSISARWAAKYPDEFTEQQLERARVVAVQAFVESKGRSGLEAVQLLANSKDRSQIWKVYQNTFSKLSHDGQAKPYQCGRYFLSQGGPTRGRVLALLIRLEDPRAIKEVADAITQDKDAQMRLWGWFMLEQAADPSLLRHYKENLFEALSDTRIGNEPIDRVTDPEAKGPHLKADLHIRICDAALRAIYACDSNRDNWPFDVPHSYPGRIGPWHSVHGDALKLYEYQKAVTPKVHNEERHVFERAWAVGFTDEQIEHARSVAKKTTTLKQVQN